MSDLGKSMDILCRVAEESGKRHAANREYQQRLTAARDAVVEAAKRWEDSDVDDFEVAERLSVAVATLRAIEQETPQ